MAWDDDLEGPGRDFAANEAARLRALAGPGTGKTHSLLRRIARLLEAGLRGTELLVLTFARTAAHDLVDKLRRLGEEDERYREVRARTLHAYSFGVLGGEGFLHASDRVPRIALEFERDFLLQDLQGAFDHTLTGRRELTKAFEAAWARAQADHPGQPVDGLDQTFQDALLGALRWHKAMLVGEVVPLALAYLRQNPNAPEREGYSHVLVDEYQDLNKAEQVLIDLLSENADLAIIGDDDQSIYAFKHANPEGIREFADSHPGTADVAFTECRRCPHRVVTLAQTSSSAILAGFVGRLPLEPRTRKGTSTTSLRSWLGLGSATALVGTYRTVLRAAQARGTSVGAVLQAIGLGPAHRKWSVLKRRQMAGFALSTEILGCDQLIGRAPNSPRAEDVSTSLRSRH